MALDPPDQRTQEQSIKARKHQLFEVDERPTLATGPRRSFQDCLRQTPAEPLSTPLKALLWTVGTIVILLLALALATGGQKKPKSMSPNALAPSKALRMAEGKTNPIRDQPSAFNGQSPSKTNPRAVPDPLPRRSQWLADARKNEPNPGSRRFPKRSQTRLDSPSQDEANPALWTAHRLDSKTKPILPGPRSPHLSQAEGINAPRIHGRFPKTKPIEPRPGMRGQGSSPVLDNHFDEVGGNSVF